ncbi:MAG: asparagine synthase (glutamine-hydrolyzing), partial [Planctomycetales bacterium]|nr:asparagine synthase (glutamine-hydrolyzing) [Planctomycetales bacterium]
MCGVAGIIGCDQDAMKLAERMGKSLHHRGPDDFGIYVQNESSLVLVHTRLAILDLSYAGHQPMQTPDGRFTIVFNGEIYNFRELKLDLISEGVSFLSESDTEVLLQMFARYGGKMVDRLVGMFALAIWDRERRELFLARDPLGIKPLYVWQHGENLAFASELRAVLQAKLADPRINALAVAEYLKTGTVPEPLTLVEQVEMLPAGSTLTWRDGAIQQSTFWRASFPAGQDLSSSKTDWASAVDTTRRALQTSILRQFVSDVPVGIFLSGGIDSTAIVSLARQAGIEEIKSFSISFGEAEFNEGDIASRTAAHFKTDHHEWRMTANDGKQLFAQFLESMDQPSNDGFNTFCISKFAHDCEMKVVLSGLGGDELFGSYPSFRRIPQMLRYHRWLQKTGAARNVIAAILRKLDESGPRGRLADFMLSSGDSAAAFRAMRGFFTQKDTSILVAHYCGKPCPESFSEQEPYKPSDRWSIPDQVSFLEMTRYMRNQLLRDSDVMS